jgi:dTDP-4-amino-4,6-dideoxygalactose transaminase
MIQFYKPTIKRKDMDSVLQTMVNEEIGPGKISRDFVLAFCEEVKATTGAAYRTYPDCLSAALTLMGARKGVRVAVSPLAPAIYRTVIENLGAEMVLVDVDKDTGCPNDSLVADSGAEILMLYENFGTLPARYNEQTTFAESCDYSSVKVIEDITESIGSCIKDEVRAGSAGKIIVCAFEEDSVLSAGGGAVMAVRGEYVTALRGKGPSKYLKMPDMNAALGSVQLANLAQNCEKRREMLKSYQQSLAKTKHRQFGLSLLDLTSNAGFFAVHLDSRPDDTVKFAARHNVPVQMAFEDCIFKELEDDPFEVAPVAASFFYRTVRFPLYSFLRGSEVEDISRVIAHLP